MFGISVKEIVELAVEKAVVASIMSKPNNPPSIQELSNSIVSELFSNQQKQSRSNVYCITAFIETKGNLSDSESLEEVLKLMKEGCNCGLNSNESESFVFDTYSKNGN